MKRLSSIAKPAFVSAAVAVAGFAFPAIAETGPRMECVRDGFISFLMDFSSDIAMQETSTADPLIIETLDMTAEPEPRMVSRQVPLAEVEWPVMNGAGGWLNAGREITITPEGDAGMFVMVRTPDTGDQQRYGFTNESGCWQLFWISDEAT